MERTGRLKSWFGRYDEKDLENTLGNGEFTTNINSLQQVKDSKDFHIGSGKFYSSGEISFAQMVIDDKYSDGNAKYIVKSFASALGGLLSSAKYGKPEVSGDKVTYTLTELRGAPILPTGSKAGEVKITFDKKSNIVDAKYIIKTEKWSANGKEVNLPQHADTIRGFLNKIYYGTHVAGNLTFQYRLNEESGDAKKVEAQKADEPKQDAKEKQLDKKEKSKSEELKGKSSLEDALKMLPAEEGDKFKQIYETYAKIANDKAAYEAKLKSAPDAKKEKIKEYYAMINDIIADPVGYLKALDAMQEKEAQNKKPKEKSDLESKTDESEGAETDSAED